MSKPQTSKTEASGFNDPAFAVNKSLPVHRWIPWIAGFASNFVSDAINKYLPTPGTILDPFCGVGTTLVEAVKYGHKAIGFEINPYAALASHTKANAYSIQLSKLIDESSKFVNFYLYRVSNGYLPLSTSPVGFKTRSDFYSPKVLRKVLIVQDFVNTIEDKLIQDIFRLAFASTMVRYSNYSYEPSLSRRVTAGKPQIEDFPVGEEIEKKLKEIIEDVELLQANHVKRKQGAEVINQSFFDCEKYIEKSSIDLVITSPPYLNNYHYNRNTRPQLYWLGFTHKPNDFNYLEHSNFGKYWQTVRENESLDLNFELPNSDIKEKISSLRSLNQHKGIYGGNGWANYASAYFNDCYKFAENLKYVLKADGKALVVIGNSILQGVMIPTDVYLGEIAEAVGLELMQIHVPRSTRIGNSIIKSDVRVAKAQAKDQLYEAVVELRKK